MAGMAARPLRHYSLTPCDALLFPSSGKPDGLEDLAAIVQEPSWAGTADLALMQDALKRQQMVGKIAPFAALRGNLLGTSGLVPRTIPLRRGTVLLIPFTLWSPSMPEITRDLVKMVPRQTIYAITSWRGNTGRNDFRSNEVLEGLVPGKRACRQRFQYWLCRTLY